MNRAAQHAPAAAASILLSLVLAACPNFLAENDMMERISSDVAVATAEELTVSIEASQNGISSPSGSVEVKEGIPFEISTTAFSAFVFLRWEQAGGTGQVSFADPRSASTTATVKGGGATLRPVFEAKPKTLYATPVGGSIPRNTRITVVFSKSIDPATVSEETVTVMETGTTSPLGGVYTVTDNMVRFIPHAPLSSSKTYYITVSDDVQDISGIALMDSYTSAFKTGTVFDNDPPVDGTFAISQADMKRVGDLDYVRFRDVNLKDVYADDDSEVALLQVYDESDYLNEVRDYLASFPWTLSPGDGMKTIYMKFQDMVGNLSPDPVYESVVLDSTPPSGTVAVAGGGAFTSSASVALDVNATDPAAGTEAGVGMEDGGTMLLSNRADFLGAEWQAYAASVGAWALGAGDGAKTVYAKFRDALGNESAAAATASIALDTAAPTGTLNGGQTVAVNGDVVTVTLALSDGSGSGVEDVRLYDSDVAEGGTWTASSGNSGTQTGGGFAVWTPAASSFTLELASGADGSRALKFYVRDKLGNQGSVEGAVRYDTTPPTLTGVSINDGAIKTTIPAVTLTIAGANDISGGVVTHVGFSNTNQISDVAWYPYVGTSYAWNLDTEGEEERIVYAWIRDAAGNVSVTPQSDSIIYDNTPPDGSFTINNNATYTKAADRIVTINSTFALDDAEQMRFSHNGSTWTSWTPYSESTVWTLSAGDGTKTVYGQFKKGETVVDRSDTIILDTTPPTGSLTILGTGDGTNAYTNSATITISIPASDATSGMNRMLLTVQGVQAPKPVAYASSVTLTVAAPPASGSNITVQCELSDKAGNTVTVSDAIVYDTTPPTLSAFSLNSGAASTNGTTVTLNSTASDAGGIYQLSASNTSGTAGFSAWEAYSAARSGWALPNSTVDGTKQVWLKVRDRAGNESAVRTDTIVMDRTAPTISSVALNGGAAATPSLQSTITINSADSGGSLLSQYRLYYNGTYGDWKTLSSGAVTVNVDWPFTPNAGTHTVYAQVKDGAGNESSWPSDGIVLQVPTPQYARKGFYTGGTTTVWGTIAEPTYGGTNVYEIYSSTDSAANPNTNPASVTLVGTATVSGTAAGVSTLYCSSATSPKGELRYFFMRVRNTTTGGYGPYSSVSVPGWSGNVTIIYNPNDSTDTALAQTMKSLIESKLEDSYSTTINGTTPDWKAVLVPQTLVSTTYLTGTTDDANYRYRITGDPLVVTPGTTVYGNANQVRNLTVTTRGVIAMGFGGTKLLDVVNSNWVSWGLGGQQPSGLGYLRSAGFSDATVFAYTWTTGHTVWTSPLTSSNLPSGHNTQTQLSYQSLANRYSIYSKGGAALTGGWLMAREPSSADYFPIAQQGRFVHFGYSVLPNRPITGGVFCVNLIARMDDY